MFTDRDVDTVLYGYVRSPSDSTGDPGALAGHALSGLRVEQLSYGQSARPFTLFSYLGS